MDRLQHRLPIRQGDLATPARARAFVQGAAVDLTVFVSITFRMVHRATGAVITGAATGDAEGVLLYAWGAGETDVLGIYDVTFTALDGAGLPQTFPQDVNLEIEIIPAI